MPLEQHPTFALLVRAELGALTGAARMIAALLKRGWGTGTSAFRAASDAITEISTATSELIAASWGTKA